MRGRVARVIVYKESTADENKTEIHEWRYPETKIDFKVSQVDTEKPDACIIKIYGVSKNTYSSIKAPKKGDYKGKQHVDIYYGDTLGESIVYSGTVTRVIYSFENGSQTLTCLISKDINKFSNMAKSISSNEIVTLSTALSLISKAYGYNIITEKSVNTSISVGKISHTGTIGEALDAVLSDKYKYYVNEGSIRIYDSNSRIKRSMILTMNNGLLKYPTEDSKGEKVTINSILIPYLESGIVIKVPIDEHWFSKEDTKNYREFTVGNYSSSFSNGLGISEMECVENDE